MSNPFHANPLVNSQWLVEHLDRQNFRTAEVIWGKQFPFGFPLYEAGHIPGAINLAAYREAEVDGSFKAWCVPIVREDGTSKSPEELILLVESVGITSDKENITYCLRGGLSTHAWFVLTQLLDDPNLREHDRFWAEWGMPVEK